MILGYQALRVVHALGFRKTFTRLLNRYYPVVVDQRLMDWWDVRVVETATGRVTNFFDVCQSDLDKLQEALHPELFTVTYWHPLLSDGPVHPDEFDGSVMEYEESGFDDNCLACTDSERYDDHMHPDEDEALQ